MVILVKLFGIMMVGFGVVYLIKPQVMKQYIAFWKKGNRIYTGGIISILASVIFLLAAAQCRISWFVVLMGIIGLIKGIALLMLGPKKWEAKFGWWISKPVGFLRMISIIAIAMGVLLIYSA